MRGIAEVSWRGRRGRPLRQRLPRSRGNTAPFRASATARSKTSGSPGWLPLQAEEFALFDQSSDLLRHHLFPTRISLANLGQDITRKNRQTGFIHIAQTLDK